MPEPPPGIMLPPPKGLIQVENLGFKPPTAEKPILRGLSFTVSPGETLGIVGPSAAGKSTLCRLLVGVWAPTVGSVRLDSAEVHSWNREEFGRYVGYLPQDVELFSGSVRENIARMEETHDDEEVIAAAKLADVHDMVLRLPNGYDTQIGVGGAMLSAGQRQRVGLARALFRGPQVVVLDEPNSNLDRVGETALQNALKTLHERGATVIMVVHHAKMLENTDKLLLIEEGRISSFGPRDEVLARLSQGEQAQRARSKSAAADPSLVQNPTPKPL
jgi:ABC-type protease/lipase transport system fused ATPase/permease subunit